MGVVISVVAGTLLMFFSTAYTKEITTCNSEPFTQYVNAIENRDYDKAWKYVSPDSPAQAYKQELIESDKNYDGSLDSAGIVEKTSIVSVYKLTHYPPESCNFLVQLKIVFESKDKKLTQIISYKVVISYKGIEMIANGTLLDSYEEFK